MTSSRLTPEQASRMSLAEQHEWFRRATSRRALLRGGALGAGAALAGPALLAGTASAATAATRTRKSTPALVTKGDWAPGSYLPPFGKHIAFGADPSSQISVAWQTAGPPTRPFIRIGQSPFDLGHQVSAEVRNLSTPFSVWDSSTAGPIDSIPPSVVAAKSPIEQYYLHAQLSGLRPGPVHLHRVRRHGRELRRGRQHQPDPRPEPRVPPARRRHLLRRVRWRRPGHRLLRPAPVGFLVHAGGERRRDHPVERGRRQPRDGALVLARRLRWPVRPVRLPRRAGPVLLLFQLRQRGLHRAGRERRVLRDPGQPRLLRRRAGHLAGQHAEGLARAGLAHRLHRRLLPPLRLLHVLGARLRR